MEKFSFLALLLNGFLSAFMTASRCFLPIKIHAQVFLWLGSNIPRKSFFLTVASPIKEPARACVLDEGAAWSPWHCNSSKRYESFFNPCCECYCFEQVSPLCWNLSLILFLEITCNSHLRRKGVQLLEVKESLECLTVYDLLRITRM